MHTSVELRGQGHVGVTILGSISIRTIFKDSLLSNLSLAEWLLQRREARRAVLHSRGSDQRIHQPSQALLWSELQKACSLGSQTDPKICHEGDGNIRCEHCLPDSTKLPGQKE